MYRLLILSCSKRKIPTPGLLSAIDRYDGGSFRVLRKMKRIGRWPTNLDVLILSAKYGLIDTTAQILNYEYKMDPKRAKELRAQSQTILRNLITKHDYSEIYIDVGREYLPVIRAGIAGLKDLQATYVSGRIGERLMRLKQWLMGEEDV